MNNDAAILVLLADRQREIEALRAENAGLRAALEAASAQLDDASSAPAPSA